MSRATERHSGDIKTNGPCSDMPGQTAVVPTVSEFVTMSPLLLLRDLLYLAVSMCV